jgi:hypothetical protein
MGLSGGGGYLCGLMCLTSEHREVFILTSTQ